MFWSVIGIIIAIIILGPIVLGGILGIANEIPMWIDFLNNVQSSVPENPVLAFLFIIAIFAIILLILACYELGFFEIPQQLKHHKRYNERYGEIYTQEKIQKLEC